MSDDVVSNRMIMHANLMMTRRSFRGNRKRKEKWKILDTLETRIWDAICGRAQHYDFWVHYVHKKTHLMKRGNLQPIYINKFPLSMDPIQVGGSLLKREKANLKRRGLKK